MSQTRKTGSMGKAHFKSMSSSQKCKASSFKLELESGLSHFRAVCEFKQVTQPKALLCYESKSDHL